MRTFFTIIFAFGITFFSKVHAQDFPRDEETGEVIYQDVVEVNDVQAKLLYFSALKFYRNNFSIEKLSIQDPENYTLSGPMFSTIRYMGKDMFLNFDAELEFKDGRYRYVFNNYIIDTNGGGNIYLDKGWKSGLISKKKITERSMQSMDEFISLMKDFIVEDSSEDDW